MGSVDWLFSLYWYFFLLLLGLIFLPITSRVFKDFVDRGYAFSKIIGLTLGAYTVWLLASLKLFPFSSGAIFGVLGIWGVLNLGIWLRGNFRFEPFKIFLALGEEVLFLGSFVFWVFIKGHQPDIFGLEKYMDFGFINSILRSNFMPPADIWYAGETINYYYFGHFVTAVLTKITGIPSAVTFNLMLSSLLALSIVASFSLGLNLWERFSGKLTQALWVGILTAFLVTLGGNLHPIYVFTKGYVGEKPVPPWEVLGEFNIKGYWYPNATRFIPYTIHEFPSYSWVVSDLHGHVLDIPVVLLAIALFFTINSQSKSLLLEKFLLKDRNSKQEQNSKFKAQNTKTALKFEFRFWLLGLLLAVMYMTNAFDALVYLGLSGLIFWGLFGISRRWVLAMLGLLGSFLIFSLPFNLNFKPFASVLCEYHLEGLSLPFFCFVADRSAWWMWLILWGFFLFNVLAFLYLIFKKENEGRNFSLKGGLKGRGFKMGESFILLLGLYSLGLLVLPEIIYFKDIYPQHYRANTMFKLGYQAFIMLSLVSAYVIGRFALRVKERKLMTVYFLFLLPQLFLVSIYPYFAINSYFNGLQEYQGLNGLSYLKKSQPDDYEAVSWLNKNIAGQPVVLEAADRDSSYTDYQRISSNTGLPTVVGWAVHEWLWRGSYDLVSPRIAEVERIYESSSLEETKRLMEKYKVEYVYVGELERERYRNLDEGKFWNLGEPVFGSGKVRIFKIRPMTRQEGG